MTRFMIAFILSRFSGSMITLIMKLIPAFAALAYLSVKVFGRLFEMFNRLYLLLRIFSTEAYVCGAVLVLALGVVFLVMRREKRVDVI